MSETLLNSYKDKIVKKIKQSSEAKFFEYGPELSFLHVHKKFTSDELSKVKLNQKYRFKERIWSSILVFSLLLLALLSIYIIDISYQINISPVIYLCLVALFLFPIVFSILMPRNEVLIDSKEIKFLRGGKTLKKIKWEECLYAYFDSIMLKNKNTTDWTLLKFLDHKNQESGISLSFFPGISKRELGKIIYTFMNQNQTINSLS